MSNEEYPSFMAGLKIGADPLGAIYSTWTDNYDSTLGGQGLTNGEEEYWGKQQRDVFSVCDSNGHILAKTAGLLVGTLANAATLGAVQLSSLLFNYSEARPDSETPRELSCLEAALAVGLSMPKNIELQTKTQP